MKTAHKSNVRTPYKVAYSQPPVEEFESVQDEVQKLTGDYEFTATVAEDTETKRLFNHVPGMIAFVCTLRKDGKVIGCGRGASVLTRVNRYVDRTVQTAFNASIVDAVVRGTKILDAMHTQTSDAGQPVTPPGYESITDRQRSYLETLIGNVADEDEREQWMERLSTMTRDQASAAIATLKEF